MNLAWKQSSGSWNKISVDWVIVLSFRGPVLQALILLNEKQQGGKLTSRSKTSSEKSKIKKIYKKIMKRLFRSLTMDCVAITTAGDTIWNQREDVYTKVSAVLDSSRYRCNLAKRKVLHVSAVMLNLCCGGWMWLKIALGVDTARTLNRSRNQTTRVSKTKINLRTWRNPDTSWVHWLKWRLDRKRQTWVRCISIINAHKNIYIFFIIFKLLLFSSS